MEKNGAGGEKLPEYHLRAMYRLDWKVRGPPARLPSQPTCLSLHRRLCDGDRKLKPLLYPLRRRF